MTLEAPICQPFMKGTSQTWRESYHISTFHAAKGFPNEIIIYCSCLVKKNATFVESQDSQTQPLSVVGEHLEKLRSHSTLPTQASPLSPSTKWHLDSSINWIFYRIFIDKWHMSQLLTDEHLKNQGLLIKNKRPKRTFWTKLTISSCIILFHQTLSNKTHHSRELRDLVHRCPAEVPQTPRRWMERPPVKDSTFRETRSPNLQKTCHMSMFLSASFWDTQFSWYIVTYILEYVDFNVCIASCLHLLTSSRQITNIECFDPLADEICLTQATHQHSEILHTCGGQSSLVIFETLDHYTVRWS